MTFLLWATAPLSLPTAWLLDALLTFKQERKVPALSRKGLKALLALHGGFPGSKKGRISHRGELNEDETKVCFP